MTLGDLSFTIETKGFGQVLTARALDTLSIGFHHPAQACHHGSREDLRIHCELAIDFTRHVHWHSVVVGQNICAAIKVIKPCLRSLLLPLLIRVFQAVFVHGCYKILVHQFLQVRHNFSGILLQLFAHFRRRIHVLNSERKG